MDPLTYRYPRTLEEAWGPGARNTLVPTVDKMDRADKIVVVACTLAALAFFVLEVIL